MKKLYHLSNADLLEYRDRYRQLLQKSTRLEQVKVHLFDVKFAYHVVRLLDEVEQILIEGDIDLQRNREQLKAIRRGEMTEEEVRVWASDKERQLEALYATSLLPHSPDEEKIKELLLQCLEEHYGRLEGVIAQQSDLVTAMRQIRETVDRIRPILDAS